jgi:hypothetical protein
MPNNEPMINKPVFSTISGIISFVIGIFALLGGGISATPFAILMLSIASGFFLRIFILGIARIIEVRLIEIRLELSKTATSDEISKTATNSANVTFKRLDNGLEIPESVRDRVSIS